MSGRESVDRPKLLAQPSRFCCLNFLDHLFGSGLSGLGMADAFIIAEGEADGLLPTVL